MDASVLEKIGLNSSEAQVYITLMKTGSCKASRIAKETGFHRTTIYKALETLIRKGLISSVIKENRKYFEPAKPSSILQELDRQESEAQERRDELISVLPLLDLLFEESKDELEATIFKGQRGLKTVFNEITDVLGKNDEFLVFGVPSHAQSLWGFFEEFNKKLQQKGVKHNIIFDERATENIASCRKYNHQVKTLPKEYMSPAEIDIYIDTVAIILWGKNPLVIKIKGEEIVQSFTQYFNILWKMAK